MSWQNDKARADKFLPSIRSILRKNLMKLVKVREGTDDEDQKQATDYVIEIEGGTVCARCRDHKTGFRDITIRAARASGVKTELTKLRDGFGKYYLYIWGDLVTGQVYQYVLFDIDKIRAAGLISEQREIKWNRDGKSGFVTIQLGELADAFAIIDSDTRAA